jgi:hypothetical protein
MKPLWYIVKIYFMQYFIYFYIYVYVKIFPLDSLKLESGWESFCI